MQLLCGLQVDKIDWIKHQIKQNPNFVTDNGNLNFNIESQEINKGLSHSNKQISDQHDIQFLASRLYVTPSFYC